MENPYQATSNANRSVAGRKCVRRYVSLGLLFGCLAGCVSLPGLRLLGQEQGWYPTNTYISGIELNGHPVSNVTFIRYSLGIASVLFIASVLLFGLALRNSTGNRRLARTEQAT
ncbi:MAG: hypothetical protein AAGD07_24710 [Planctomycetota bacterium]